MTNPLLENNTVYIGKKGTMAYVLAVVTQLNHQDRTQITIKARGKAISRAVDVAEIVRHKFLSDIKVNGIRISTEELPNEMGGMLKVSSIEIELAK